MSKKSLIVKQKKTAKYKTRAYNRCYVCGRPRGYMRYFKLCRICFRTMANQGILTGVRKSSW